ncbi:MAG: glycosyltransferase family 2 protein [Succinivibrio sp.]|nr:glycosyltransferase family 2 protein [Succinivibrio sp.]
MATLSVIILTRNEQGNIEECIKSLGTLPAQIVVADSRSDDDTAALARALGAEVIEVDPQLGFGKKRRLAQQHCTAQMVLHVDADERLTEAARAELGRVLAHCDPQAAVVYALPRLTYLFGRAIRHCGWYPDYVQRLYPRQLTAYDEALVHEKLVLPPHCRVEHLTEPLLHYSYPEVTGFFHKQIRYALLWAQQRHEKGRRVSLISIPLRALFSFIAVYFFKRGFLDGRSGLWLSSAIACYTCYKYLALRALNAGSPAEVRHSDTTA